MKSYRLNVNLSQLNLPDVINCSDAVDGAPLVPKSIFLVSSSYTPALVEIEPVPEAPVYTLEAFTDLVKTQCLTLWLSTKKFVDLNAQLLSGEITLGQYAERTDLDDSAVTTLELWIPKAVRRGPPKVADDDSVSGIVDINEIPTDEFVFWPFGEIPYYSMIGAPGGGGKSTWTLGLALHIAAGRERYGNCEIRERSPVLIINMDEEYEKQWKRIWALKQTFGITDEEVGERIQLWKPTFTKVVTDGEETAFLKALEAKIKKLKVRFLIIDPLVRFHSFDENQNTDMNVVTEKLLGVLRRQRCTLMIIHHPAKVAQLKADDAVMFRGASVLATNARSTGYVFPGEAEGTIQIVHGKRSYTKKMETASFEFVEMVTERGDELAGLRPLGIGDPLAWEGRDELVQMVVDGRADGRPWAAAKNAEEAYRLDAAVDARWGAGTARQVLPALVKAGVIQEGHVKVRKKPKGFTTFRAWTLGTGVGVDTLVPEDEEAAE